MCMLEIKIMGLLEAPLEFREVLLKSVMWFDKFNAPGQNTDPAN